ncbi:LIC_13387 family protein [Dokdonella soli]|uniref:DUF4345 domain-containing protein n=1 Tax=Dokdonella soli TaxID=529810 RepID=A0ABP3U4R5_9GAMM
MNATLLYRIAAVLLVLFTLGHTIGFLHFVAPTPEARAVHDAMYGVTFLAQGSTRTYGAFYEGFGLNVSVYLVFSVFLAWHLGQLARTRPEAIGWLGWAFCTTQIAGLVLAWIYFFIVPVIFSALVALCLGAAAWLVRKPLA